MEFVTMDFAGVLDCIQGTEKHAEVRIIKSCDEINYGRLFSLRYFSSLPHSTAIRVTGTSWVFWLHSNEQKF